MSAPSATATSSVVSLSQSSYRKNGAVPAVPAAHCATSARSDHTNPLPVTATSWRSSRPSAGETSSVGAGASGLPATKGSGAVARMRPSPSAWTTARTQAPAARQSVV